MGTSKQTSVMALAAAVILLLLSWNKNDKKEQKEKNGSSYDAVFSSQHAAGSLSGFDAGITDEFDWAYNLSKPKKTPPADDVMVQRIPGDNFHILVMAVYANS